MSDEFDWEQFLNTQITLPAIENILEPIDVPEKERVIVPQYEGELMKSYLATNKLTQQHLDVYNQFLKKAANIICSKKIPLDDGRTIHFDKLAFSKPYYRLKNVEHKLYPMYARRHLKTYDSEWSVYIIIKKNDKVIYTSKNRVVIAKCPVMLFSDLCHLTGMNASELIKVGEDPLEQGGYFIIVGVEKIIMLEEKLSTNRIFIMLSPPKVKKYKTAMKLTTNTNKGTFLNEIIYNNGNIMKYSFQTLRKKEQKKQDQFEKTKKLNVIYVYHLFSSLYFNNTYCTSNQDIIDLIKPYLLDQKSIKFLYASLAEPQIINKDKTKPLTAIEIITKKMGVTNLSVTEKNDKIKALLKTIYEHLEDIDPYENETVQEYQLRIVKTKIQLLSLMIARYLDHLAGIIPLDDRDDWANKRVEGPGRKMEQLMRNSWNKVTKDLNDHTLRDNMKNEDIEKSFHGSNVSDIIAKIFRDSFINSKWGLKGSNQKNNATQTLVRDNLLASLSHLSTINVNIQRTDKNMHIRMVQVSQYRSSCYVYANEGDSCFESDTPVYTPDGRRIAIKDLKNGDEVLTIDPLTLKQTASKIYNHFIKSTEEYGKPVFKITTLNGREIVCTDDHPFLTDNKLSLSTQHDWKHAKDLDIKNDLLVIYPGVQPVSSIIERKLILDNQIMKEKLITIGVKPSLIEKHINELNSKKLLPLYSDDERLPIIARIAGFSLTDGSLCIDKNGRVINTYYFGLEYNAELFFEDMKMLGYPKNTLSYNVSTITDKKTLRESTHHTWNTSYHSDFPCLLLALDLTYGRRINKEHKPVPDWVMNGSLLVKREFVAGFQGGDGSKLCWFKRHDKVKAGKFNFHRTGQHKCNEHVNSLVNFMNQLVLIFEELGVKVLNVKTSMDNDSVDKEIRHLVEIHFSDEETNLIKYMEMVGYRYATTKSTASYHISEYLKYKHNKIQERIDLKNKINDLYNSNVGPSKIAKQLNLPLHSVSSILQYKGNGGTLAPIDTLGYEEWTACTKADKNCIFMPIKSIEPHEHCMVSDFTTVSDNHSFIADGFVTHNCGLVKKLAITTKLALDRGIEGDRIIMVLVHQYITLEKTLVTQQVLMLNGKPMGWCDGKKLREILITYRRAGEIYYDTSFYLDEQFLYIDSSPSRLLSPVLIVDLETQKLVIDVKNITDLSPQNLINEGAMEYISAWEEHNLKIAMDIDHLYNKDDRLNKLKNELKEAKLELSKYIEKHGINESKDYESLENGVELLSHRVNLYDNTKPFTHSEMSGRAALGVAADMIPFMQHNQAPRNIYQCLWKEEPVLMADGSRKPIKDVKIGDEVVTFNPETFETSTTKVVHHYVRKTDKLIYKVTTESGREIIATEDHKFMTSDGWCEVKDIKGKLLGVSLEPKYLPHDVEKYEIINEDHIRALDKSIPIEKHINDLKALNLLPLMSNSDKLPIIARVFGFIGTDGSVGIYDKGVRIQADFGSREDAELFENDIVKLGFERRPITYAKRVIKNVTHRTWKIQHGGALATLLIALGINYGNRVYSEQKPVPEWIMNGSLLVKREFLAGFQGGDGCQIHFYKCKNDKYSYGCAPTQISKIPEHINSLKLYMVQIDTLFNDLGVETLNVVENIGQYDKLKTGVNIRGTQENLIKYFETISYKYNNTKMTKSGNVVEFFKYKKDIENYKHKINTDAWFDKVKIKGSYLFVPIKSIELVKNCEISDITVASENHSFIGGNGIMSKNCSMGTQAVGNYHLFHKGRFDGTVKVLESPTPPIVKTAMYDTLGLAERGMGQNINIAFIAMPGTEEDAFIFNQGSVDRGLFRMVKYFSYQGKVKISDANVKSKFAMPNLKKGEDPKIYENLNEHGLPIIGSYIKEKQCIIGIVKERNGIESNASIYLMYGEEGIVDDIRFHETPTYEIVEVKLRITRKPEEGDKYAARMAQKGTIGKFRKHEDMPFDEQTGMTPDVIVNTTVIPSRMTISYLMELIAGKAAAYYGETVDASAFQSVNIDKFKAMLSAVGVNPNGYSKMRDGETGRLIEYEIYSGIVYFQALKHQPKDKISVRSLGAISSNTRQPVKGRQLGGGLRFGEMESDTYLAHGSSAAIKERLCNVSDKYKMAICKKCATTSVYNDIDKKFYCPICTTSDAGAVTIPYIKKYQDQLLATMGFDLRSLLKQSIKNVVQPAEIQIEEDESDDDKNEETEESEELTESSSDGEIEDDDQISGDNDVSDDDL
jgi:DNA-directed RNA polymerase subunit B'